MYEVPIYDNNDNTINYLVQFDKDIYIRLKEDIIDGAYLVSFFNSQNTMAYMVESTYENGVLTCKIPNILLRTPMPIFGYVAYGDTGQDDLDNVTVRSICGFTIPVKKRAAPADYVYEDDGDYISFGEVLEEAKQYADEKIALLRTELQTYTNTAIENMYDDIFVDVSASEGQCDLNDQRFMLFNFDKVSARRFIKRDTRQTVINAPSDLGNNLTAPFHLITEKISTADTADDHTTFNKQILICTGGNGFGRYTSESNMSVYIRYVLVESTEESGHYRCSFAEWQRFIGNMEFANSLNTKVDKISNMGLLFDTNVSSIFPNAGNTYDLNSVEFLIQDGFNYSVKRFIKSDNKWTINLPDEIVGELVAFDNRWQLITEKIFVNDTASVLRLYNKQTLLVWHVTESSSLAVDEYARIVTSDNAGGVITFGEWDKIIYKSELDTKLDRVPYEAQLDAMKIIDEPNDFADGDTTYHGYNLNYNEYLMFSDCGYKIRIYSKNDNLRTDNLPSDIGSLDNTIPFTFSVIKVYANSDDTEVYNKQILQVGIVTGNDSDASNDILPCAYTRYFYRNAGAEGFTAWQKDIDMSDLNTAINDLDSTFRQLLTNAINQTNTALAGKVDKVAGKGLSANDYTNADKSVVDALRGTTGISNSDIDTMLADVFGQ